MSRFLLAVKIAAVFTVVMWLFVIVTLHLFSSVVLHHDEHMGMHEAHDSFVWTVLWIGLGSTALMTVLRQRDNTVFVGEATGGNPDGTTAGILFFLKLPNSGITARVPWFLHVPDSDVTYGGKGLEPDVPVDVSIGDLVAGRDPILERALELAIDP